MPPRDGDLGALAPLLHVEDVDPQSLIDAVAIYSHPLFTGQDSLHLAQIEGNVRPQALHGGVDDLPLLLGVGAVEVIPLGLPNALQDHLLGRLSGDAPEVVRGNLELDLIPHRGHLIHHEGLSQGDLDPRVNDLLHHLFLSEDPGLARDRVEFSADVLARTLGGLPVGRDQSCLNGIEDHFPGQISLGHQLFDGNRKIAFHLRSQPPAYVRTSVEAHSFDEESTIPTTRKVGVAHFSRHDAVH